MFCRRQRFCACGRDRSLNRRGQRPLVSADSFGFLFVATGDESLTPQRAFRSLSLRLRLPPSADSPLAKRRPLETFGAVPLLLYSNAAQYQSPFYIQKSREPIGSLRYGIRRRPMLPGRVQPSTFGTERLNFCVRDGNRWDPLVIATGNGELFTCGDEKEQNCFLFPSLLAAP